MTRKKRLLIAGTLSALAVSAGVVIAYFGAKDDVTNIVGIGEDTISVTEAFQTPEQEQDFSYRKLVKIQNTGSIPCYIRAALEFSNSTIQNAASFSSENQGDSDPSPADTSFKKASIPDSISDTDYYVNSLPEGWVYVWDANAASITPGVTKGYYYYTKPVEPGESTDALISWIKMNYNNSSDIQAHDVFVYSESVQTIDPNTGAAYGDWKNAWHTFAGGE